jgi:hypothetical protein
MSKRKSVTVFQENNAPINMLDEDDNDLDEYSKTLSEFMSQSNISILQMSSSRLIIRPSKITSIYVDEIESDPQPDKAQQKQVKPIKKSKKPVKKVDIITDVD